MAKTTTRPTYAESDATKTALENLTNVQNSEPGAYVNQYDTIQSDLLNQALNRTFSYDFNADPLYQQYKDQYTKLGNEASMNAVANASAMTGGYANSYAATAGAQANQQYMTALTDKIPELYQAALDKYNADTENLTNTYSMVNTAEQNSYNKYQDSVTNWMNKLNYYNDYYQNSVSNDQWSANYNENNYEYDTNMDYQKERDAVSDEQWQKEYDYQKSRDDISDEQWQKEYDYQKSRDDASDAQWQQEFNYQKERDLISDSQWAQEYALSKANSSSESKDYSGYESTLSGIIDRTAPVTTYNKNGTKTTTPGRDVRDYMTTIAKETGYDGVVSVLSDLMSSGKITETDAYYLIAEVYSN